MDLKPATWKEMLQDSGHCLGVLCVHWTLVVPIHSWTEGEKREISASSVKDWLRVRTPSGHVVRKRPLHKACQISEERLHWGYLYYFLEGSGLFFCLLILRQDLAVLSILGSKPRPFFFGI